MVTKRKSEFNKARGDTRRAVVRMLRALPVVARVNWRNIVMPWRLIPMPVALALIALVALAMLLDTGDDASAQPAVSPAVGEGVVIGADTVAAGTRCAEDEVITYRALIGGSGVGCEHYEYLIMDFIGECLIGNAQHGENLASYHLRFETFRSWCDGVVDDGSDGALALADILVDVGATSTPTMVPTSTVSDTSSAAATPIMPSGLPITGSR